MSYNFETVTAYERVQDTVARLRGGIYLMDRIEAEALKRWLKRGKNELGRLNLGYISEAIGHDDLDLLALGDKEAAWKRYASCEYCGKVDDLKITPVEGGHYKIDFPDTFVFEGLKL